MVLNFITNKYLLMWYLLCKDNNINEIREFKQYLITNYKKEYFLLIKEKDTIKKYLKDYIPDDDYIFNMFSNTDSFKYIFKQTNNFRNSTMFLFDKNKKKINKELTSILKYNLNINYNICFLYNELQVVEFDLNNKLIILGKDIDPNGILEFYIFMIYKILEQEYKSYKPDEKEIVLSVLELVVYNELYSRLTNKDKYHVGNNKLSIIKEKIHPYFLMYLGVNSDLFNYNIKYDNNLKLMDLYSFISYIIKNKNKILESNLNKKDVFEML